MNPNRWRLIFIHIATLTLFAVAFCAWRWRGELSWWPARPVRVIASAAFLDQSDTLLDPQARAAIDRSLRERLDLGPTFAQAVDQLQWASGVRFYVNWDAIWPTAQRETPISLQVGGQRLADAVATLLRAADPRHQRLAFTVRVLSPRIEIQISSRDDLMMNVTTRVYDVRDLITGSSATPPSGGIVDRLKRNIAPETWKDRGGRTGAISELSGQLIITQTHDNQMLVEYELAWLRWRNKMLATAQHAAWIVAPTFFAAISLESILMLRRRRIARRIGLCRNCGYDLRASTERCPECGRPIDAAHRPNVADPVITS